MERRHASQLHGIGGTTGGHDGDMKDILHVQHTHIYIYDIYIHTYLHMLVYINIYVFTYVRII